MAMITIADMRTSFSFLSRGAPLDGMRNAKNPARNYLNQAYLHLRHLSHPDRLKRYPRRTRPAHHVVSAQYHRRGRGLSELGLEAQDALFDLVEAGEVRWSERLSGEDREVDLDRFGAGSSRRRL
jgi:hypothetical protein